MKYRQKEILFLELKKTKNHRRSFKKKSRANNKNAKGNFKRFGKMASLFLSPWEFQSLKSTMKKYL